jgi:hypothetical protein
MQRFWIWHRCKPKELREEKEGVLSCSMQATCTFAATGQFKTLKKEVASFYEHYVEPGHKKRVRGFDVIEKWMKNIKTFTEQQGDADGRFDNFEPSTVYRRRELKHFSVPFLFVMRFTFSDVSGIASDPYHDNFVMTFKTDPVFRQTWIQVLKAMFAYLQVIEVEHELEFHWLQGKYSWCQQKLAECQATQASSNRGALQQMKCLISP